MTASIFCGFSICFHLKLGKFLLEASVEFFSYYLSDQKMAELGFVMSFLKTPEFSGQMLSILEKNSQTWCDKVGLLVINPGTTINRVAVE